MGTTNCHCILLEELFGKEPEKNPESTGTAFIKDLPGLTIKSEPKKDDIIGTITVVTDPSLQKSDDEESPTGGIKDMENKPLDEQSTGDESQNAKSQESTQDDKGIRFNINKLPMLVIKLDNIKVHTTETVTVMQEMMDKLPPIGY